MQQRRGGVGAGALQKQRAPQQLGAPLPRRAWGHRGAKVGGGSEAPPRGGRLLTAKAAVHFEQRQQEEGQPWAVHGLPSSAALQALGSSRGLGRRLRVVTRSASSGPSGSAAQPDGDGTTVVSVATAVPVEQQQQQQQEGVPPPVPPPPPPPASLPHTGRTGSSGGWFSKIFKALQDFGIGRSSLAEGGVGLFVMVGIGFAVALVNWARGTALRTGQPYQVTVELPLACGVTVGTPLRIRGVQVGQVLNVRPSLQRVDVLCEVNDVSTVIPRNSVIEANQSGLIAEPLLDITPQLPLPNWHAGPHEHGCADEGAIVCVNGRIQGQPGVALDDLVYIMTRLARQAEADGFDKVFAAAEAATNAIEEARPLLAESIRLVEEVTPLLKELREGGLVANVEALTSTAAAAAADIQKLQGAILTEENVRALRQAVLTLCRTLEHVEGMSADVSLFTRDSGVQRNLKTLVQALSRLVEE